MTPLFAMLALQTDVVDVAKDPLYAKRATVEIPMAPVPTIVEALAKATGQPLSSSGLVRDWKATMLVKDLPAGRAMEALADTLGLVWRKDSDGYVRLGWAEGEAAKVAVYRREEADLARKQADLAMASNPTNPGIVMRVRRGRPGRFVQPGIEGGTGKPTASRYDVNLLTIETGGTEAPSRLEPAAPAGSSAFAKAVLAWPTVPEGLSEAWGAPVSPSFGPPVWGNSARTLADFLTAWHAASGLPVVADAFRLPLRTAIPSPGPALATLQALADAERMSLRVAGGVARLRHPAFWRLREQEIPETKWSALERSAPVTLASLSAFATGLTPAQAASFRAIEAPVSKVSTVSLSQSYPALLLWSSLPGPARTALLSGKPVALAAVRGASNAYGFALREAPYYDGGDPTPILAMNPGQVGLFGRPAGKNLELRLSNDPGTGVYYLLPL